MQRALSDVLKAPTASAVRLTITRCACSIRRRMRRSFQKEYGVPTRYLGITIMSPWAAKRLHEFGGDITKFRVVKVWLPRFEQVHRQNRTGR